MPFLVQHRCNASLKTLLMLQRAAAVQVASRLWVLWGLIYMAPHETSTGSLKLGSSKLQLNMATLLIAWSISEILRYSLYAFKVLPFCPTSDLDKERQL